MQQTFLPSKAKVPLNNREIYTLHYGTSIAIRCVSAAISIPHFHSQDVGSYMLKSVHIVPEKKKPHQNKDTDNED